MKIVKSKTGGRNISGDTPYGKFAIAFSRPADSKPRLRIVTEDGREVGEAFILFREPTSPKLTASERAEVERRAAICNGCEFNTGVTETLNGWEVWRVKCKACGCGGLSLLNGKCPENLW